MKKILASFILIMLYYGGHSQTLNLAEILKIPAMDYGVLNTFLTKKNYVELGGLTKTSTTEKISYTFPGKGLNFYYLQIEKTRGESKPDGINIRSWIIDSLSFCEMREEAETMGFNIVDVKIFDGTGLTSNLFTNVSSCTAIEYTRRTEKLSFFLISDTILAPYIKYKNGCKCEYEKLEMEYSYRLYYTKSYAP